MTAKELIIELLKYDGDIEVLVSVEGISPPIKDVELQQTILNGKYIFINYME